MLHQLAYLLTLCCLKLNAVPFPKIFDQPLEVFVCDLSLWPLLLIEFRPLCVLEMLESLFEESFEVSMLILFSKASLQMPKSIIGLSFVACTLRIEDSPGSYLGGAPLTRILDQPHEGLL